MPKIPDAVPWKSLGKGLGAGGQAAVELVEPRTEGQFPPGQYALKALKNSVSKQAIERFAQEIDALSRINHPGVVKVVDHFGKYVDDFGFRYYVMEYDESFEPLERRMFSAPQSPFFANPTRALEFIATCADAVGAVHNYKLIHRDLKPENVLVNWNTLQARLIDFGCCQADGDGASITLTDEGVGTQNYMAPECEAGAGIQADHRADIYSLGKIFWSLLTAQRPFARENAAFTTRALPAVLPDHPSCWHGTTILEGTVRRNRDHRFSSCADLGKACRDLSRTIVLQYPPPELAAVRCPSCGGKLSKPVSGNPDRSEGWLSTDARWALMTFKSGTDASISVTKCEQCGYVVTRLAEVMRARETRLRDME